MKLLQKQVQQLNQNMKQSLDILQMTSLELEEYLYRASQENPVIDINETERAVASEPQPTRYVQYYSNDDHQNRYYAAEENEFDPLARIGCAGGFEETLERFLLRQLERMHLDEPTIRVVRYLIACLDERGYFTFPLAELAQETGISTLRLARGLNLIRSLEPAGVGAADLSQCLELQLQRIHYTGPAFDIVRDHLPLLARHHYRAIADKLGVSLKEIQEAESVIRELEPRPGGLFQSDTPTHYIQPDLMVEQDENGLSVQMRARSSVIIQINSYYRSLFSETGDPDVKSYLASKLRQAEDIKTAVEQRENTLQRCAQSLIKHQYGFFVYGPHALRQLKMMDVAEELGVHVSTISRTVRGKYIQCSHGLYPMKYFFAQGTGDGQSEYAGLGATAAKDILRKLIENENKEAPMSDQQLSKELSHLGCAVSRRTVAKYREELGIPSAYGRKS